jgi:hypothetical protein
MSATVRPDNLKAALDAKIAAALAQLAELRESEEPRITPHLNPRELVASLLLYAHGIYSVASSFGRAQVGELQYEAWYEQWKQALGDADRGVWRELSEGGANAQGGGLIDVEILVTGVSSAPHDTRKRVCRFAAYPQRSASDLCAELLRLGKRFAGEFMRDHARFLR